ncbi:MAG: hypothetical protein ABSA78_03090 [Candidatus Sulfotelmatobacter sp.]|jgi:hypothetical protein
MTTASQLDRKVQPALAAAIPTFFVVGAMSYRGTVVSNQNRKRVGRVSPCGGLGRLDA